MMSHLIKIYAVSKFSFFHLLYSKELSSLIMPATKGLLKLGFSVNSAKSKKELNKLLRVEKLCEFEYF